MVRDRYPLVNRFWRFQNDVAPDLVHLRLAPSPAQRGARCAPDTSRGIFMRRTRFRRGPDEGEFDRGERSKKNAAVASTTLLCNSSHVSPSVKKFSVRHSAQ